MQDDGPLCSVAKFLTEDIVEQMVETSEAKKGDLVLILAGPKPDVLKQLGQLRLMMGKEFDLIDETRYNFLWVTEFPLLEWDEETRRYHAMHHPFTSPREADVELMDSDPGKVKARAYDLVLNGNELGGGSIRIHDQKMQRKVFELLGIGEREAEEKFGFLLDAFKYGAPPHGGIAFGFDRLVAILGGHETIRDYIAFPKNNSGRVIMIDAPSKLDDAQLSELHLEVKP
jgi:aspartyl-tRNA synthetase